MNRRGFLAAVAASIPAMVLDPERLLWVPGKRSYFDIAQPAPLLSVDWITIESMKLLSNEIKFMADFQRNYDECFPTSCVVPIRVPRLSV